MGTLRSLFALSVVFDHTYGYVFVGGRNAVQLFYMISGFLISYIIVEKKSYPNIKDFYINRYLRLYPIYFIIASFTLIVFLIANFTLGKSLDFFTTYQNSPTAADALLIFTNFSLFLQDSIMFVGVDDNQLVFLKDSSNSDALLYKGLLIPQAWTLGVELDFYLLAPIVLTRRKTLITLLTLSISLRAYLIYLGLGTHDPWTYRFFPTELAFFILGAISHQVFLPFFRKIFSEEDLEKYSVFSTYVLILITLVFWVIPIQELLKTALLFSGFLLFMPLTFLFQDKRNWDKWIGNLSYPIYICHMLIIYLSHFLMVKIGVDDRFILSVFVITFSILLSILLNRLVGTPVDIIRDRFRGYTNNLKGTSSLA